MFNSFKEENDNAVSILFQRTLSFTNAIICDTNGAKFAMVWPIIYPVKC